MKKSEFEGLPSIVLANGQIELTILTGGGAMASLVLLDDPQKLNPLWNPIRLAREAGVKNEFGPSIGHFVCVDGFGPTSPEEKAAGLPFHGEAYAQRWEARFSGKEGATTTLTFSAKLPLVEEVLTRTVRMVDGENVVYVESQLESETAFDRPVCWAEHATIGAPFLEPGVTAVDMSAHRARARPHDPGEGELHYRLASGKDFNWPMAPALKGGRLDMRVSPKTGGVSDHTTCQMDPARKLVFVTALNPVRKRLLGYVFRREDFPWLQSWEYYPVNGAWARGLEFSTQPFDVPRREAIQMNALFDTPTYRWLPARSRIGARFLMFYANTPDGMRQIDDVRWEKGRLIIEDHTARKRVTLAASLEL
ncbi:MAG: hypothetical protein ABSH32_00680 [Bryobacteraceae bacterium]|jgi:hypothetical protein